MLRSDGTISYSGGNRFHDVSRRAALLDTGQMKSGSFRAFEMFDPDLDSDERFHATASAASALNCRAACTGWSRPAPPAQSVGGDLFPRRLRREKWKVETVGFIGLLRGLFPHYGLFRGKR